MPRRLSATSQRKLVALGEARRKWDRVHSLVEKAGSARGSQGLLVRQIRQASDDVGRVFINNGFAALAEGAKQMGLVIQRGGSVQTRMRGMREVVGVVGASIERAEKAAKKEGVVGPES